jgi:hypothetical protein
METPFTIQFENYHPRPLFKTIKIRMYEKTLLLALYGYEMWSLASWEEREMHRKTCGLKMDEVREQFRLLHNGERRDLYKSPCAVRRAKSRRLRWAGNVAWMRKVRNAYTVLEGKPLV